MCNKRLEQKIDKILSERHALDQPHVEVKGRALKIFGVISFEEIKKINKAIEQHERFERCMSAISRWAQWKL